LSRHEFSMQSSLLSRSPLSPHGVFDGIARIDQRRDFVDVLCRNEQKKPALAVLAK
jgi:hypothetical protein